VASVLPRLPQPSNPTRTAEFASVPRTSLGATIAKAPTAPARSRSLRR